MRGGGPSKKGDGLSVFDPNSKQQVIDHLLQENRGPLPDAALRHVFIEIISACRALQDPCRSVSSARKGHFPSGITCVFRQIMPICAL